jgi:hypothetical protein
MKAAWCLKTKATCHFFIASPHNHDFRITHAGNGETRRFSGIVTGHAELHHSFGAPKQG